MPGTERRYNSRIQSPSLSSDAFQTLVARGRGLAALILQSEDPTPYHDVLLAACVENLQFDRQCEENRAPYVLRLLDFAGLKERARETILTALPACEDDRDRDWIVDLLGALAGAGDALAWNALRDLAAKGDERAQDNLAEADDAGLQWVADHVLPTLSEEDRWRVSMWLPDEEADDRTDTQRRLRALRRADEARIEAMWKSSPKPESTPRELLDDLGIKGSPRFDAASFGKNATDEELLEAAERLLDTEDKRVRLSLKLVFRRRKFPLPLERLFALADVEAYAALVATLLGRIDDPAVRAFALERMHRESPDWNGLEMLRASFRPGDETVVRSLLPKVLNERLDVQHGIVLDLIALMDKQRDVPWQPYAEWAFEHSPCSFCRSSAFRWMHEHGSIPLNFLEEAPFDAESDVRDLAAKRTSALQ